jgi:uncharacterized membrane protein (UPF0182 family)
LNLEGVKKESWELQHAGYTHGYGMALAPSSRTVDGFPDYLVGDLPVNDPDEVLKIEDPQIYIGEGMSGYALVGTERDEIDYVNEQNEQKTGRPYSGTGGVEMSGSGLGGFLRRSAFALRFGEIDPLISNFVTTETRVLYVRDVRERVEKVAPFFQFDANPYAVVIDGRINYVLDGYATTDLYPYAERVDTGQLSPLSGLEGHRFNYIRNSVRAVVDAYDGTVTLYVIDQSDPITQAYREAFPDLFADGDDMPEQLKDHQRYPDDLFIVQTTMWGRYRVTTPSTFYSESENWEIAQDPGTLVASGTAQAQSQTPTSTGTGAVAPSREEKIPPYYLQMQLPGESDSSFVSLRPFVRASTGDENKLSPGFMVASSDRGDYGQLTVYQLTEPVNSPAIVAASINADPKISPILTQINQQGSRAVFGNMTVVPIGDQLLYVRPLYATATGETSVPLLRYVILSFGDEVYFDSTLPLALGKLFQDENGDVTNQAGINAIESIFDQTVTGSDGEPTEPSNAPDAAQLLADAAQLFDEAQGILEDMNGLGDLAEYQDKVEEAQQKVDDALALLQEQNGGSDEGTSGGSSGSSDGEQSSTTTTESPPTTSDAP